MKLRSLLLAQYPLVSQACGAFVMLIGAGALIGWFSNSPTLKGVRASYIPMAPNTAFVFVLLGFSLVLVSKRSVRSVTPSRAVIAIAAVLVVARMSEYLTSA